jgi:hypothetical protein
MIIPLKLLGFWVRGFPSHVWWRWRVTLIVVPISHYTPIIYPINHHLSSSRGTMSWEQQAIWVEQNWSWALDSGLGNSFIWTRALWNPNIYVCIYIYGYIANIIIYTYYILWMLRSDPWAIVSSKFHWARYCKAAKSCHSLPTWVYQSYPKLEDPKTAPGLSRSSGCGYRHCLGTARSGDKNRMNYVSGLYTRISIYI